MAAKKTKTPLQKYLSKKLPTFRRGDADCVAFVGGWVNELLGSKALIFTPKTFGDVVRDLRNYPLLDQVEDKLSPLGFKKGEPQDGSVVLYSCSDAFSGTAIGIFSNGTAITRFEGDSLHLKKDPEIIESWSLKPAE